MEIYIAIFIIWFVGAFSLTVWASGGGDEPDDVAFAMIIAWPIAVTVASVVLFILSPFKLAIWLGRRIHHVQKRR